MSRVLWLFSIIRRLFSPPPPNLLSSPGPPKVPRRCPRGSVCRGVPDAVERNAYPGLERCNRITTAPVLEDIHRGSRTPVANAHTAPAKSFPSTSFSPGSTQEPVSPDLTSSSLYAVPLGTQSSLCFQQKYYACFFGGWGYAWGWGGRGYAGGAHSENCMVFEKTYFAIFHAAHFGSMNGVQSTSCIARLN